MGTLSKRRLRALVLCRKFVMSCAELRDAESLDWEERRYRRKEERITTDDLATLGMLLSKGSLPRLRRLDLCSNGIADAGIHALCAGLSHGDAPSLTLLAVEDNPFGLEGAEVLAAALSRGAMTKLEDLFMGAKVGQGIIALATPLRKLPALKELSLGCCGLSDEGLAALVKDLGKKDFSKLARLNLAGNEITDAAMAKLVAAINSGAMPMLTDVLADFNDGVSDEMVSALHAALDVPSEARRAAQSHNE